MGLGLKMGGGSWSYKEEMSKWDLVANQKWVDEILRLNVPSIIWGGNYFITPPSRCWFIWKKPHFPSIADAELAYTNMDKNTKVYSFNRTDGEKEHPTQKPLPLIQWCITHLPKNTQTILDPFMGSGTTLVACAKMGRKGIGIELDPDYFDIACRRVEEAYRQPDLFLEVVNAKPEQDTMLFDDCSN
jgi:DNA modification methylase